MVGNDEISFDDGWIGDGGADEIWIGDRWVDADGLKLGDVIVFARLTMLMMMMDGLVIEELME